MATSTTTQPRVPPVRLEAEQLLRGEASFPLQREDEACGNVFELDMSDPWLRDVDFVQARNTILNFNTFLRRIGSFEQPERIEWPLNLPPVDRTSFEPALAFSRLDEKTAEFIRDRDLLAGVAWLQMAASHYFDGADFAIELLPAEEAEESLLALKVFGAFDPPSFRQRRRAMCEEMLRAGHKALYEIISVFQRRVLASGRQAFSWYGSLSAE